MLNVLENKKLLKMLYYFVRRNMLTAFLDNRGKEKNLEPRLGGKEADTKTLGQQKFLFGKSMEELLEIFGLLNNRVNAGAILLMVLRLRQCCGHLSLLCEVRFMHRLVLK